MRLALFLITLAAYGQTSHETVVRGPFDGSASTLFRVRVVTSDPGSCVNGELIFNSTVGSVKTCVSGAWVAVGTGGAGGIDDGCTVTTNSTTVTVASGCSFRVGTTAYTLASSAVWTISGTPGAAYVFGSNDGSTSQVTVGTVGGLGSCDADCISIDIGSAGFPAGSYPIALIAISGGAVTGSTDKRTHAAATKLVAGSGIGLTHGADGSTTFTNLGASTALSTLFSLGASGSAKTVDPANGWTQTMTLSANCTVTLTQPSAGTFANVRIGVTQAASGGPYTVTFTGAKWPGGIAPVMSTGASKIDWYSCLLDGTTSFCTAGQDFQ